VTGGRNIAILTSLALATVLSQVKPSAAAEPENAAPMSAEAPLFPDAGPLDPALAEPLTPLSEFEITARTPSPDDVAEEGPVLVRPRLRVAGLDATDLGGRFLELASLRQNRDPTTLGQISARAEIDTELLLRLLRSEGYYDAAVDAAVDTDEATPGLAEVVLTATPGERYRIGEIVVAGPPTEPQGLAREALTLQQGQPLVAAAVEAAEANIALRLPEQGYPFVQVGLRDVLLDETDGAADYTLPVDPGPRSRFGGVRLEGDPVFGPAHVATIARFERGELYDSRMVDDLRRALVATGLFSTAGVEPVRTRTTGPDGAEFVDLRVISAAGPMRSLAGSIGYGTGEGVRAEASWTHRNLFPPEGALILRAVGGDKEQRLAATFRRSNAGRRDRTLQVLAEGARERREESYDSTSLTLAARLSRDSTPIWRKRWTWSGGAELVGASERARSDAPSRTYYIAALPVLLGYDRSDDLLDPTRGFRLVGRTSPEVSLSGGAATYLRTSVDASAYLPVGGSTVLAARTRVGVIAGADRADIAPSRRYYGGGGGSVRGFSYRALGPLDASGERIGGRSLFEFAFEARYRFGDFGIVPFIDGGQASETVFPGFSDMRLGAGIGARYYTNFGPIRIDLARPLARRPDEPKIAIYISIGQAF
jgi:translocation and assembly module TamA